MSSTKYIGMDVHAESISICVRNSVGKAVMAATETCRADAWLATDLSSRPPALVPDLAKPHASHPALTLPSTLKTPTSIAVQPVLPGEHLSR